MSNEINCMSWGNSEQKMILVNGIDFNELHEHLKNDEWSIEAVSACAVGASGDFKTPYTYAYVVLERN